MPHYNTRRKSLSLPSLGIQLPQTNAERAAAANRSPPSATKADQPPSKRAKRMHTSPSPTTPLPRKHERPRSAQALENTPPPSPGASTVESRVDADGINDDIVIGVIRQLEKTGNKPHLVKELAAVLCATLDIVDNSANPQAIISSRLNSYLKRHWTALSPCPLAKELIPTHPRRIYFYLTTVPHQPLPEAESSSPLNSRRSIISPSISDEEESRKRVALSPSPEIDLSPPELDDEDGPPTPAGSFSGRSSLALDGPNTTHRDVTDPHRAVSPPLEGDEKEFTQTASSMQARTLSQANTPAPEELSPLDEGDFEDDMDDEVVESEAVETIRNREAAAALFGQSHAIGADALSSPALKAQHAPPQQTPASATRTKFEEMDLDPKEEAKETILRPDGAWENEPIMKPEDVDLDTLDDLLESF